MIIERSSHYSTSKTYYPEYDLAKYKASDYIYSIPTCRYPAALHYRLVNMLIKEFTKEGDLVFDPFCGSGTVINEALRLSRNAIGLDINPLGLLIAEVRLMHDIVIEDYIERLKELYNKDDLIADIPTSLTNPDYWYSESALITLGKIRKFIIDIPTEKEKKFFTLVLADTARYASYTRKNEFKRFRMKNYQNWNPNIFEYFINTAYSYQYKLKHYPKPDPNSQYKLLLYDTTEHLNLKELVYENEGKINLMLTSPPYGDSKTTVAYGQFSSFSLEWIDGILFRYDWRNIDKESLGGRKFNNTTSNNSQIFTLESLKEISKSIKNNRRRLDLYSYINDLYTCIVNISRTIKKGGYMIFVIGNRKMSKVQIPTDEIIAEISQNLGFVHIETRYRRILNKTMPLLNSPTNKEGKKDNTMLYEFIVILKKLH